MISKGRTRASNGTLIMSINSKATQSIQLITMVGTVSGDVVV